MPKLKNQPPKLSRIKSNNAAVVYFNKQTIYMGPWGSERALKNYSKFLVELSQADIKEDVGKKEPTVSNLATAFLKYAMAEKVDSGTFSGYKIALKTIRKRFPHLPVSEFGPKALSEIQQDFVNAGYARTFCNKLVNLLKSVFGWGVRNELVPETTAAALKYVKALREGKTTAPETEKRREVSDAVVERTLEYLWPTVAGMVQVQRLAGMRPSEVCRMMVGDLDMTGEIWIYRPGKHKGTWRGHHKSVALGIPEQEIIRPRLEGKSPENAVFSPRDTETEKKAFDAARRKTPVQPSQRKRAERRAKNPRSRIGEHYDSGSYARSIKRSIEAANKTLADPIPHWTPYQLRHAAGTAITASDGIDVARAVLGHRTISTTAIYNHADEQIAIEAAKKRGKKPETDP